MTKIVVAALTLVALTLVAAGGSQANAAKRYRVAFVTDFGGVSGPIGQKAVASFRRASRDLPVDVRIVVQPVRTSFSSTFRELARQRYDLVMTPFSYYSDAVVAAARAYPEQRFVVGESDAAAGASWPPNVLRVSTRDEEIGFVVGYLAGLVERRRPGTDAVGSVGGLPVSSVDRFIAGFQAGARRASPRVRLRNAYSYNFGNPSPCRRIAEAQIAKGVGVVFNVAGGCGVGALAAARKHDVWGIGVDQDQSGFGPHILTSALKDIGLVNYRVLELLVRDELETGGMTTFGLEEDVLRLGRVSPRVPRALVEKTRRIQRAVRSGRITGIPTTVAGS